MSLQDFSADSIRKNFLEFFEARGHKVIPSSSLVPKDDPTVLFTTAGMQQFKRFYLFPDEAPAAKVATVQKCLRTGDIDEVGDETHLTFFEMLGNFSFGYPEKEGSYFKEEAIKMAWEYLTEELGIKEDRISATYFAGDKGIAADDESKNLIKKITGLDDSKILGTGFDETFWSLGTEGSPGGPTVEFYVDGVEIWNLVFNEYKFTNGEYIESEQKGVDTGMGFERLVAVMQEKDDVFQIDIFEPLISKIEGLSGKKYGEGPDSKFEECWVDVRKSMRIVADHIRASEALVMDGVVPSNKDRGYILRRLIRRAIVQAKRIGINENFCGGLVGTEAKKEIEEEEGKFRKTMERGLKIIESKNSYTGKDLFDLYQTYGIPKEVAEDEIKRIHGGASLKISIGEKVKIDEAFKAELKKHQEKSRTASSGMFKGGLADKKPDTTRLHTAAHLLLAALRQVLGDQVQQKGSNITEERLRFDFNNPEKLTPEQIAEVEKIVNEKIAGDLPVEMEEMSVEEAKESGATGVFDDRYGDKVKVYTISYPSTDSGQVFSREICGGPHVKSTGELGHFKITKEESSSAGVRRIKAILE